jgi:hypothetical protein
MQGRNENKQANGDDDNSDDDVDVYERKWRYCTKTTRYEHNSSLKAQFSGKRMSQEVAITFRWKRQERTRRTSGNYGGNVENISFVAICNSIQVEFMASDPWSVSSPNVSFPLRFIFIWQFLLLLFTQFLFVNFMLLQQPNRLTFLFSRTQNDSRIFISIRKAWNESRISSASARTKAP